MFHGTFVDRTTDSVLLSLFQFMRKQIYLSAQGNLDNDKPCVSPFLQLVQTP